MRYSTAKTIYSRSKQKKSNRGGVKKNCKSSEVAPSKQKQQKKYKEADNEHDEGHSDLKRRKSYQKAEPNWRVEAPVTRKRVKITDDKSKEALTCKIKLLSGSNDSGTSPSDESIVIIINWDTNLFFLS